MELENRGVDVNKLKEITILRNFVGWTEDWEKEKCKVDGTNVLFANKHKNMCFVLPDTGHMYFIQEAHVVYSRRYDWVIYVECDLPRVLQLL